MNDQSSPLEQIREKLAVAIGGNAVFDGWSQTAVDAAADSNDVDREQARLAVPKDQAGKIDLYIRGVDRALEEWFTPERLERLKIREKIRHPLARPCGARCRFSPCRRTRRRRSRSVGERRTSCGGSPAIPAPTTISTRSA